jgi:hypothetical protein
VIVERAIINKDTVANIFTKNKFLATNRRCEVMENPLVFAKRAIGKAEFLILEF